MQKLLITHVALLSIGLAACSSSGITVPGSSTGSAPVGNPTGAPPSTPFPTPSGSSGAGLPSPTSSGQPDAFPGGLPDAGMESGSTNSESGSAPGGGRDPSDVFDESLGDFDGRMQRERDGIAGSGAGVERREQSDSEQVQTARNDGGLEGMSGPGGQGDFPDSSGSENGAGSETTPQSTDSGERAGEGQTDVQSGMEGGDVEKSQRDGAMVGDIPEDIPQSGSGDDQVARQIREAAMAETDPEIREALWEEYRRHTGIKKK